MSDTVLRDPGYPKGDLTTMTFELFGACGLTWVFYGPDAVSQLFAELAKRAPIFNNATALGNGLGRIGVRDDLMWSASEGPNGSAVALFCFPNADSGFVLDKFVLPTDKLSAPWKRGMGTVGGKVDSEIAHVYSNAHTKPVWEIAGLESMTPAGSKSSTTQLPALLRDRLLADGWEELQGGTFKATVPGHGGRTQLLFFASVNATSFSLLSPISESADGTLPALLRGHTFPEYSLDVVGDMVVLIDALPSGPPSPTIEEIRARGLKLAEFADRIEADLSVDDVY